MSSAVPIQSGGSSAALGPIGTFARAHARTRWWVELLAIGWLFWLYDAITNLAPLRLSVALGNARGVLHFERVLHIDPSSRSTAGWPGITRSG